MCPFFLPQVWTSIIKYWTSDILLQILLEIITGVEGTLVFPEDFLTSASLCQSCDQTSCLQKLRGRLWSRGVVCWRTWTASVECSNFRLGRRRFRPRFTATVFKDETMRGCILTCDQNGCNEAHCLDSQHVAVISGPACF